MLIWKAEKNGLLCPKCV